MSIGISRGNLAEAMEAARQAAEVSRLMLTYLGQTQGKFEPLDLAEVCRRSLTLLRTALPGTVVLETDLPAPGPTISSITNQSQQVLTNLVAKHRRWDPPSQVFHEVFSADPRGGDSQHILTTNYKDK